MGSIPGAFVAALLIAEIKALCIGIGHVSIGGDGVFAEPFTLVAEFVVMAIVLVVRPWGLLGRAQAAVRGMAAPEAPLRPAGKRLKMVGWCRCLRCLFWRRCCQARFPTCPCCWSKS